jgi:hypothetical protein
MLLITRNTWHINIGLPGGYKNNSFQSLPEKFLLRYSVQSYKSFSALSTACKLYKVAHSYKTDVLSTMKYDPSSH